MIQRGCGLHKADKMTPPYFYNNVGSNGLKLALISVARPAARMLCSVALLAVSLQAYTPVTGLPSRTALNTQRLPATMVIPKGNADPNFDPDAVDPDAVRRTVVKTGVVWVVVGGIVALVTGSGKEFNSANAPGYAEATAKKSAAKKASLDAYNARVQALEAKRNSGAGGERPPRPWEK